MGMAPQIKSKEAKTIAAANASKGKKKKWSRGKAREKVNKICLFENDLFKKFTSDVSKYKMISVSVLSDRLNINGSLARATIKELAKKKLISKVVSHNSFCLYVAETKH